MMQAAEEDSVRLQPIGCWTGRLTAVLISRVQFQLNCYFNHSDEGTFDGIIFEEAADNLALG
jgi:hypothetical protein